MKSALALFLTVFTFSLTCYSDSLAQGQTLRFTTFNIKFYGLGGDARGTPQHERRDGSLRDLLTNHMPQSDVIAFQEVVDVPRLQNAVVPRGWQCMSYSHRDPVHQHVVLCHRPGLRFLSEPSDNNDVIDEVAVEARSRPALHLIVADQKGTPITRVVAVHLKAFPDHSATRLQQAKYIGDYLSRVPEKRLPVVILGDSNTYPRAQTGAPADDHVAIGETLTRQLPRLREVKGSAPYTYRTLRYASNFDRIWIAGPVEAQGELYVFPACNLPESQAAKIQAYNDQISDHCPVSATLKF